MVHTIVRAIDRSAHDMLIGLEYRNEATAEQCTGTPTPSCREQHHSASTSQIKSHHMRPLSAVQVVIEFQLKA